jgi:hypothetical protein
MLPPLFGAVVCASPAELNCHIAPPTSKTAPTTIEIFGNIGIIPPVEDSKLNKIR